MSSIAHTPTTSADTAPARLALLLRIAWQRHRQERSSRWSHEALARHQAEALGRLRRLVAERSPFYRRFHRGREAAPLAELPILDKATLMAEFDELVTDREIRLRDAERHLDVGADAGLYLGRYTVLSTSGSTGRRGVFLFDEREWVGALAAITRPIGWSGGPQPWQRPRAALIASGAPWHYSARVGRSLTTRLMPTLRLDAARPLAEMVAELNQWQPVMMAAYPSVLRQLADEQLAGRLRIAPVHLATSAERLTDETRQRVRQAWGLRVFDTYGATEYAPIASECAEGSLHLLEDRAIIEVIDDRGRTVPPGEAGARLLLTVLDRRVQPLIRYEISDGVRERPGRCRCGRPFRMLERIEGRVEESLRLPSSTEGGAPVVLHPIQWHALLERVPATGWQVIQNDPTRLDVRLTGEPRHGEAERLRESLQQMLRARGAASAITVSWVTALERGASGKALQVAARKPPGGA